MFNALRNRLLGISPEEASFVKRGFPEPDPKMQPGLERVLKTFIEGYNLTLEIRDYDRLCEKLEREFDNHYVGFAFEGVGMCLCLLDLVTQYIRVIADVSDIHVHAISKPRHIYGQQLGPGIRRLQVLMRHEARSGRGTACPYHEADNRDRQQFFRQK